MMQALVQLNPDVLQPYIEQKEQQWSPFTFNKFWNRKAKPCKTCDPKYNLYQIMASECIW